jgi:hypothetical protein
VSKLRTDPNEEKILIDGPAELQGSRADGEEDLQMSATSYPGQEWNPYMGGFDDWNDRDD